MKIRYLILLMSSLALLAACTSNLKPTDETLLSSQPASTTSGITYSNLVDKASQEILVSTIGEAIPQVDVEQFLTQVNRFNETVPTDSMVQKGFEVSEQLVPAYDVAAMSEEWTKKFPYFPGYNCRLTTFQLLHSLIDIAKTDHADDSLLFIDQDAINHAPQESQLIPEDRARFQALYGAISTENVTDIAVHQKKVVDYWKEHGINFRTGDIKMISVWFHDQIDSENTKLFIGHVGVLIPSVDGYLFVEKISFEEPYQVLKFDKKAQVKDYLMGKYDVDTSGSTKPFLMENNQPL